MGRNPLWIWLSEGRQIPPLSRHATVAIALANYSSAEAHFVRSICDLGVRLTTRKERGTKNTNTEVSLSMMYNGRMVMKSERGRDRQKTRELSGDLGKFHDPIK